MQPFDKQTDDVASLNECGATLVAQAADSLSNGTATREAYAPAIDAVGGQCAPLVQQAGDGIDQMSVSARGTLAWAAVATRYWGSRVETFNARVDEIVAELGAQGPRYGVEHDPDAEPAADAEAVADARDAARAEARRRWWEAHGTYIADGSARTSSMLAEGPTPGNIEVAVDAGALPPMSAYGWDEFVSGLQGMVTPPTDQGQPGSALWATSFAMRPGGWVSSWMNNVAISRYTPGYGLTAGRHAIPFADRGALFRLWDARRPGAWKPTGNYTRVDRLQWSRVAKNLNRAGWAVSAATGAWDQWSRDQDRTDLSTGDRVTRSAVRGGLNAAGGAAGAWAGAKGGAMLGAAVGGPVGAAIGGVVSGLVGGAIGSGLAGKAADAIMESDFVEGAGDVVQDIGESLGDAGEAIGDAGEAIGDAVSDLKFW